jgi:hypothetical protein
VPNFPAPRGDQALGAAPGLQVIGASFSKRRFNLGGTTAPPI